MPQFLQPARHARRRRLTHLIRTRVSLYTSRRYIWSCVCLSLRLSQGLVLPQSVQPDVKGKGSPYSITERGVPELIPVLGSQPAGDISHKPGGELP